MFIACNKLAPITSSKTTTVHLGKLLTYKFYLYYIQVATALQVAGPNPTLWIPRQTLSTSTASWYSKALGCLFRTSRDDHAVQFIKFKR